MAGHIFVNLKYFIQRKKCYSERMALCSELMNIYPWELSGVTLVYCSLTDCSSCVCGPVVFCCDASETLRFRGRKLSYVL